VLTEQIRIDIEPGWTDVRQAAFAQALLLFGNLFVFATIFLLQFQPTQGGLAPGLGNEIARGWFGTREDPSDHQEFHVVQMFERILVALNIVLLGLVASSIRGSGRLWHGTRFSRRTLSTTRRFTPFRYRPIIRTSQGLLIKPGRPRRRIHVFRGMLHNLVNEHGIAKVLAHLLDVHQVVGSQVGQEVELEFRGECDQSWSR
jgi:hypothetical protein